MKWTARLRFKACGYGLVRQELDSVGNVVGEPTRSGNNMINMLLSFVGAHSVRRGYYA